MAESNATSRFFTLAIIVLLVFGAYQLGVEQGKGSDGSGEGIASFFDGSSGTKENVDMSLFWRARDLLKSRYVDKKNLTDEKLTEGAIRGLYEETGDPYTVFLDAEENKRLGEDISGSFEGIGAEIGMRDKILTIVAPLPDSPAQKAGLRSGDKILKIDDTETSQMSLEDAVQKIHGKKGTNVVLTIFREGESDVRPITVTRDTISVKSVTVEYKENNIAYVKLMRFGDDTARNFGAIVDEMITRNVKGIVLDMRNNPGGLLQVAVDVSGKFLEKGSVVVQEEYSDGKRDTDKTIGRGELKNIPVVVLVNEGSASAAEILAGALKDNRGDSVTLVGKKTFGKGSVQELIPLPKDAAVKITVAKWFTPSGKGIDKEGINPDVEVDLSNEDFNAGKDPQLEKAMELLKVK